MTRTSTTNGSETAARSTAPLTAPLTVRALLFARYADLMGRESVDVQLTSPATVRDVVDAVRALPGGNALPARPLCARNLAHVGLDAAVVSGDEIGLLPPLAGG